MHNALKEASQAPQDDVQHEVPPPPPPPPPLRQRMLRLEDRRDTAWGCVQRVQKEGKGWCW